MRHLWAVFLFAYLFGIALVTSVAADSASPSDASACLPVLTQDYYSYARDTNTELDWLKSIDASSYKDLQEKNDGNFFGVFNGGTFDLKDDYSKFSTERDAYLEKQSYKLTRNEALNVLQRTTSPRAYDAYAACLRSVSSGLTVWADRESLDQIHLIVRYQNPSGVTSMTMKSELTGGSVQGAPAGALWAQSPVWTVNQEKPFTIVAQRGSPETDVTISPDDGEPPQTITFKRADATVQLLFEGSTSNAVQRDLQYKGPGTQNNDGQKGHCAGWVGNVGGNACVSGNNWNNVPKLAPPYYYANARVECPAEQPGCQFVRAAKATISDDGLRIAGYIENWGPEVYPVIHADKYEHLAAAQCGNNGPLPIVGGQSVVLEVPNECKDIAVVEVTTLPNNATSAFKFGSNPPSGDHLKLDSLTDSGTVTLGQYSYSPE